HPAERPRSLAFAVHEAGSLHSREEAVRGRLRRLPSPGQTALGPGLVRVIREQLGEAHARRIETSPATCSRFAGPLRALPASQPAPADRVDVTGVGVLQLRRGVVIQHRIDHEKDPALSPRAYPRGDLIRIHDLYLSRERFVLRYDDGLR